jgi:protocatechuate 3,4-dioxygenase beta subunit
MHSPTRRSFFQLGLGSVVLASCARRLAAAPTPHIADDDPPPTCGDATAANIEGPFYKKGAPHRAVLVGERDAGERLVIAGVVRSTTCAPLAGAEMEIWHADARGGYDNDGFHFRGALATDARGRWELRTIVPGRYMNGDRFRPAHVHIKLRARGHRALTTQLYFAGDPYNDGDPFIVDSLVMEHKKDGELRRAAFDFVLART